QTGAQAPQPVGLEALAGGRVRWPLEGESSLLVFLKSDCPTCRLTMPFVDRLDRRLRTRGARTRIAAVIQDPLDDAADFAPELGLALDLASEPEPYPLASAFGVRTVPTLFLVGEDGRVHRTVEGFDRDALEDLRREAGAGAEPLFGPADSVPAFRPG